MRVSARIAAANTPRGSEDAPLDAQQAAHYRHDGRETRRVVSSAYRYRRRKTAARRCARSGTAAIAASHYLCAAGGIS